MPITPVPLLFALGDVTGGFPFNPLAGLVKSFTKSMLSAVPVLFSASKQVEQAETGSDLTASTTRQSTQTRTFWAAGNRSASSVT